MTTAGALATGLGVGGRPIRLMHVIAATWERTPGGRPLDDGAVYLCGARVLQSRVLDQPDDRFEMCDRCSLADFGPGVYRFNDVAGRVLYIGATRNLFHRMQSHAAKSAWWPRVAGYAFTRYPSIGDAYAAERDLIRELQPPFNRRHLT